MVDAEAERVEKWNSDFFAELGFSPDEVINLLLARADPHEVAHALERGCTIGLALRIYL